MLLVACTRSEDGAECGSVNGGGAGMTKMA